MRKIARGNDRAQQFIAVKSDNFGRPQIVSGTAEAAAQKADELAALFGY